jgi:serine/threonine-protein kinase RsbW
VTEETTASAMAAVPSGSHVSTGSPVATGSSAPTGVQSASSVSSGSSVPAGSAPLTDPAPAESSADGASTAAGPRISARPLDVAADQVTVRMPADGAYLSVLRTATAGLAARLDFTLDDIEDMRIAVDEACAMLLGQAIPGSILECNFTLSPDDMTITVSVPCLNPRPPSGETFAWTVLSALTGTVEAQVGPGDRLAIVMRKSRPNPGSV